MKNNFIAFLFALCCICHTTLSQTTQKPKKPKTEQFGAVAYLPRATARTASNVDVRVNGYSTDDETQQLAQTLVQGGQQALVKALEKAKSMGRISLSGRVGSFDLKLIRSRPTEGGRRIIAMTDRPFGFLEAYNSGRSTDYELGILVIDLKTNTKGKEEGDGTLLYAANLKIEEGNRLEIEHIGIDPIRLGNVRRY